MPEMTDFDFSIEATAPLYKDLEDRITILRHELAVTDERAQRDKEHIEALLNDLAARELKVDLYKALHRRSMMLRQLQETKDIINALGKALPDVDAQIDKLVGLTGEDLEVRLAL